MDGQAVGLLGIVICVFLCGCGSAIGLFFTGSAASGILAEDPKKFSKALVMVVLPATQGIYGFVFGIIAQGTLANIATNAQGWQLFAAALPLAIAGFTSAIFQGKTSAAGIYTIAKNESLSGKLILFPAMVETYAILGLVISILFIPAV